MVGVHLNTFGCRSARYSVVQVVQNWNLDEVYVIIRLLVSHSFTMSQLSSRSSWGVCMWDLSCRVECERLVARCANLSGIPQLLATSCKMNFGAEYTSLHAPDSGHSQLRKCHFWTAWDVPAWNVESEVLALVECAWSNITSYFTPSHLSSRFRSYQPTTFPLFSDKGIHHLHQLFVCSLFPLQTDWSSSSTALAITCSFLLCIFVP